jgi:ubiquinone/menaquinone biosynthesis C-methylase UbiE
MTEENNTIQTYERIAPAYFERHRDRSVIEDNIDQFDKRLSRGSTILDIGCGPGFDSQTLRNLGHFVVGMDLCSRMLQLGKQHYPGPYIKGDMVNLPFQNAADGLWVSASLLHIARDAVESVLAEFHRVLKPGGTLFVAVKEGSGTKWEPVPYDVDGERRFTYWSINSLEQAISKSGFQIDSVHSNGTWIRCFAKNTSA